MGSHVALVKGNRQIGFQVDRATHIFFLYSFGLMRSPDGISCWFWLKGIAGRDLRLAQPHTGYWFWLKGIVGRDLRLAQPHTGYWFWLKGIAGRDLKLAQPRRFWVLVQGDRRTGSHKKKGKKKKRRKKKEERKKERRKKKKERNI